LLDMKSADDLAEKLSGTISHLTVSDCFITLFHAEDELLPEESELTFAYKDNVVLAMTDKKLIFPTRDILPDRFFRSRERKEYHLDLLMTPQRRLGYLIFNFNLDDRNILQSFREVVSNSLFSRQLMVQVDSQKEDLKQNLETMRRTMSGFIQTLQQTVETRDPYTAGHQRRVSDLARRIAQRMGLPDDTVESIRIGAIIHDLGKIYIPAEILNKPGQLRDIEVSLLRSHPEIAYDIIKPIDFPWPIAEIILQHHEHLDGTGYPRELKGDAIRIEARIISVADVVEAMASHRPYRAALGIEKALQEIRHYRGRWYDADAVDACIGLFTSGEFEFGDSPEETPYILSNHEHHTLKYRKQTGEK
ncbi:MAG: HD-GYP domain-containing protein, partial [Spirochaetota bacterium]